MLYKYLIFELYLKSAYAVVIMILLSNTFSNSIFYIFYMDIDILAAYNRGVNVSIADNLIFITYNLTVIYK